MKVLLPSIVLILLAAPATAGMPSARVVDARVAELMRREQVQGLALALVERGKIRLVRAYGLRNAERGEPLDTDTVMYGASLTKAAFAWFVLLLVEERRVNLDAPLPTLLPKPLTDYPEFSGQALDERWRQLTPRILLTHGSGLANFGFLEPDQRLRFHFDPGTRYAYSGAGINLLQFVLEQGLGIDVGVEMRRRVFVPLGLTRTSMTWRDDFAGNVADGYRLDGRSHDQRRNVRAAGSMDTTIADQARLWSAVMRGEGLSARLRDEWWRRQMPIVSAHQFPTLAEDTDVRNEGIRLSAGLGVVSFLEESGPAWFKGGHNDSTGNMVICQRRRLRCIVLLSNDVRAERIYPELVEFALGTTRMPWRWEYNYPP
jgi:CubicO group peptidase (beta-lactamase class C family)